MMMLVVVGWQDGERSVKDPLAHWEINKTGKRQEKLRKLATATANSESNKTIFTVRQTECVHHVHCTCKWIDKKKRRGDLYSRRKLRLGWMEKTSAPDGTLVNEKQQKVKNICKRTPARCPFPMPFPIPIPDPIPHSIDNVQHPLWRDGKRKLTTACASSWLDG